jgi:hypothetical protein
MEIITKYHKKNTICNWKQSGVIHDNFDELYDLYISTFNCQNEKCAKPFKNTRDRCLDHDHEIGEFRLIVCQKCNIKDSYIKYPDGYDKKEYMKEYMKEYRENNKEWLEEWREENKEYDKKYREENKEKIKKYKSEKITCICGSVVCRDNLARHKRSATHMKLMNNGNNGNICN